jgi:hypothetical protein
MNINNTDMKNFIALDPGKNAEKHYVIINCLKSRVFATIFYIDDLMSEVVAYLTVSPCHKRYNNTLAYFASSRTTN